MRDGALKINQDVSILNSIVSEDEEISFDFGAEPYTRQQVVKGSLKLDGEPLPDHRRAAVSEEKLLKRKLLENWTGTDEGLEPRPDARYFRPNQKSHKSVAATL